MCGRRGVLQHGEVGVVLTGLAGILAQAFDAEFRETEPFDLGYVHGGVAVDEVGWRSVCLVAGDGTVLVSPTRPLLCEVLQKQVAERLTVVGHNFLVSSLQE